MNTARASGLPASAITRSTTAFTRGFSRHSTGHTSVIDPSAIVSSWLLKR